LIVFKSSVKGTKLKTSSNKNSRSCV